MSVVSDDAPCANCGDIVSGESQVLDCDLRGQGGSTNSALASLSRHTKCIVTCSLKNSVPGSAAALVAWLP